MAEIIQDEGGKKKGSKHKPKKHSTHIDMTPMVDLACLLLTFFMLTTAFSKPKVMEIVLPEKDDNQKDAPKIEDKRTVNILLDKGDKVYFYNGGIKRDAPLPQLQPSDYSKDGIRKMLLDRNKEVFKRIEAFNKDVQFGKIVMPRDSVTAHILKIKRDDKIGPIVLIKAAEGVKYGNMVDIIDEMAICNIAHYAIVDITPDEKNMLANAANKK